GVAAGGCERASYLAFIEPCFPGRFSQLAKIGEPGFQDAVGGPEQAVVAVAFRQPRHPSGQVASVCSPLGGTLGAVLRLEVEKPGHRTPVEPGLALLGV